MVGNSKKKVCVFTATRAEYGLLRPTMSAIRGAKNLELQTIVTGTHLSKQHGYTLQEIERDGFTIDQKIDILSNDDSRVGMALTSARALEGTAKALSILSPDIVLLLGDRYEVLAAASAAMLLNLPIAHCHGGESTFGLIDEQIRHAVTKLSHLHFTSTEQYRRRVIQLGEDPNYVFNVGALGLENIHKLTLLPKERLAGEINWDIGDKFFLVTFHPITLDGDSVDQLHALLSALDHFSDYKIIFTMPNADADGLKLTSVIEQYVRDNSHRAKLFSSLGALRYLSVAKCASAVLGNSSSGLIEIPSLGVPTVNIGRRQEGRIAPESVVQVAASKDQIVTGIKTVLDKTFLNKLINMKNPYDGGESSSKITAILSGTNLKELINKRFYDL